MVCDLLSKNFAVDWKSITLERYLENSSEIEELDWKENEASASAFE